MQSLQQNIKEHFRVVARECGAVRSDLPTFAVSGGLVKFDDTDKPPLEREDLPHIPGAFVLHNVLTAAECDQLIEASEFTGYTEDAAVSLGRDIRHNENCVWIAQDELCTIPFERCRPKLPVEQRLGAAVGLNARWRFYKYGPGDIFKAHTDGSWPGSGIEPKDGSLVRDAYGDRWSLLTWVLYLNDNFKGGATRFFLDDDKPEEVPARRGSALCFYHGHHPWSHVHEGGKVHDGTKYIIRSDVLYMLPGRS
mmetsp:Transcript_55135/g.129085  ORF Transcript_55135/g.129085 Transcript_55135/m.129085 type:complete len:252 (-) Transcript_55135:31-786(-)